MLGLFGTCPCGGEYEPRNVEVTFTGADGEPVPYEPVPQGVCTICASRVYAPDMLALLESLMRAISRPAADG